MKEFDSNAFNIRNYLTQIAYAERLLTVMAHAQEQSGHTVDARINYGYAEYLSEMFKQQMPEA